MHAGIILNPSMQFKYHPHYINGGIQTVITLQITNVIQVMTDVRHIQGFSYIVYNNNINNNGIAIVALMQSVLLSIILLSFYALRPLADQQEGSCLLNFLGRFIKDGRYRLWQFILTRHHHRVKHWICRNMNSRVSGFSMIIRSA